MSSQYELLSLADGMSVRKYKDFFYTSRGRAPLSNKEDTTYGAFLTYKQARGKVALYDSHYDVYVITYKKYLEYTESSSKIDLNSITWTQNGNQVFIGNADTFLEYSLVNNNIYIYDFEGDIYPLMMMITSGLPIKKIYSKKPLAKITEVKHFYFASKEIYNDSFIIKEGQRNCLIGNYIDNNHFDLGFYKYAPNKTDKAPLLLWPRHDVGRAHELVETNYYHFIEQIKVIKEFDYEMAIKELAPVRSMGGYFYLLMNNDEIVGFVCFEKMSSTFCYVSYLAIIEKYRKTEWSSKLIDNIKALAWEWGLNIILTIEERKLLAFYKAHGFKAVCQWDFE